MDNLLYSSLDPQIRVFVNVKLCERCSKHARARGENRVWTLSNTRILDYCHLIRDQLLTAWNVFQNKYQFVCLCLCVVYFNENH